MKNINTCSEGKIWWYDFIFWRSDIGWSLSFPHYRWRNIIFSVNRRMMLIFRVRYIVKFRHDRILFWIGFVINWFIDFVGVCIGVKGIDFFPIETQNVTWWLFVLFIILSWSISNEIVDWFCHPWTTILLLLCEHFSEKL